MQFFLIGFFFLTAILYASVGFGGGSTYNALLILSGADHRIIPLVALACNIIVVSGNTVRYARAGLLRTRALAPAMILSVPLAWVGGRIPINELVFSGLLGGVLLVTGLLMLLQPRNPSTAPAPLPPLSPLWLMPFGAGTGLLAGLVGIGGGIFLAPILYVMRWGDAQQIAAACSLFILVNSVSGIAGQAGKLADLGLVSLATPYWPLLPAVAVGGWIGNAFGIFRMPPARIRQATGILILIVAIRLLARLSTNL
ncbi:MULTISPECIES: sulfite exporter TauE/SafE family protein [Alphaproteobacteria]|uniref:sulfite exporter TauE/SafE family protein n=2 Tax=Pseudomonadota TaxID=1224 RepID=UPI00326488F1